MSDTLSLRDVHIALHGEVLLDISADVTGGEVLTIMGPSGSGKSTLLAYIGGFMDPVFEAFGTVRLGEEEITRLPAHRRRTGILFQDALLFPHMSVGENLQFALGPNLRGKARRDAVEQALDQAGLADFYARDPATLSGGQKARAALMRVLLSRPRALLLDEPFSKLDSGLRGQIRQLVFEEAAKQGLPTLLVTHDAADAEAAKGRVITLD